jgi:hypothetical protein
MAYIRALAVNNECVIYSIRHASIVYRLSYEHYCWPTQVIAPTCLAGLKFQPRVLGPTGLSTASVSSEKLRAGSYIEINKLQKLEQ